MPILCWFPIRTAGRALLFLGFAAAALRGGSSDIVHDLEQGQELQSRGRFAEAARLFQMAAQDALQIPEHPKLRVAALCNLANVEIDLGHSDTAARLYTKAIQILSHSSENNTDEIDAASLRLAELYLEMEQTATAEKLIDNVIAGQQSRSRIPALNAAFAFDLRAGVYAYQKKFSEAERAGRQALNVLEASGIKSDPGYAVAAFHLASFLNMEKRPAEGLPFAQKALTILQRLPVRQAYVEAETQITLASLYSQLRQPAEAHTLAEQSLQLIETLYGPDDPRTGRVLLAKAAVLRTIKNKTEARAAQQRGEKILAARKDIGASATIPVQALLP